MKLLVVLNNYTFPPQVGSAIVAYNTMKLLSQIHSIDLVYGQTSIKPIKPIEFISRIESVFQKRNSRLYVWLHYFFHRMVDIPPFFRATTSNSLGGKVKELLKSNKYDAILLFELNAIQFCPSEYYEKIIVNVEDPQSIKLRRLAELSICSKFEKFKMLAYWKLTERYEKKVLPKLGKVLLLSKADMLDMQGSGVCSNIGFVSYGVNQQSLEKIIGYERRKKDMIVFSGSMFHQPNVDGALFFLQHIFPLVLYEYPTAVLWVVGAEPDKRIYNAAAFFKEHVVITGRVDDMSEYLQYAKVSICPIRLKIGVLTKILEALSWGTPVVTTSAGNSGIGGCSGIELFVEDEPHKFASRVVELLQGENWMRISDEGRKFIEKKFSWHNSVKQLNMHIEELVFNKSKI